MDSPAEYELRNWHQTEIQLFFFTIDYSIESAYNNELSNSLLLLLLLMFFILKQTRVNFSNLKLYHENVVLM